MRTDSKHAIRTRQYLVFAAAICLFQAAIAQAQVRPDLTVVDQWEESGGVHFKLKNSGTAPAKAGHTTGLAVDGAAADTVVVSVAIAAGDTYEGSFPKYYWKCTADGSHKVVVRTDVYDTVSESNEKNNSREETWICDVTAPKITEGPKATSITQTSASIIWATNEDSDSLVQYGTASGVYKFSRSSQVLTTSHDIALDELKSGTKYYYMVQSADASGNAVQSDERTFRTEAEQVPAPDLIVDSLWEQSNQIRARIKNAGTGAAPANHRAGLYTNDRLVDSASVAVALNPGETADVTFVKFYFECHDAEHVFRVAADIDDRVAEQDETNNDLDGTIECDVTPLRILDGPSVASVTTTTADIAWVTNKPSDSNVVYDCYAGVLGESQSAPQQTIQHTIRLQNLTPGTVYQFQARSANQEGQSVESKPACFRTKTKGGKQPNITNVTFERESTEFPCYRMTAVIEDENGVDKVEFFADGTLLLTDYSPPFEAVLTPGFVGTVRGEFFRPWRIETIVSAGGMQDRWSDLFEPAYECDTIRADFEYPFPNERFYIPGDRAPAGTEIPLRVNAYKWDTILHDVAGVELLPGLSGIDLEQTEWPLVEVRFYVNGAHIGTVPSQSSHLYEIPWRADNAPLGTHVIRADAVANDQCIQTITEEIEIEQGEPEIEVTRQVWREENAFRIRLNIHNRGTVSYLCECVRDNVDGLQPIQDAFDDYLVWTTPSSHGQHNDVILDLFRDGSSVYEIPAHHTVRLEYYAIPVQYFILGAVKYEIGEDPVEVVDSTGSDEWTIRCPCIRTEDDILLDDEIDSAIEGSDYLIITNPDLCDSEFGSAAFVLSEMARLAYHRNGILGYPFGAGSDDPVWIRDCVRSWGREMSGSDGVAGNYLSNGYLLLVGETEILPAWTVNSPDIEWAGDTETVEVGLSDLPYGDVASSDNVPELCVGRIIGDSAGELTQAMTTSLNAGFDRSYGVVTSGSETDWENFVGEARSIVAAWNDQAGGGEIMTEEAKVHHWSAHVQKEQLVSGYDFPMDSGDGFVTGNLAGYGMSAVRVDPGTGVAYVVTAGNLDLISTPFSGAASFSLPFASGDALTAGDIDGDGEDEIVAGNLGLDRLVVVCDPPSTTAVTYLGFDADLEAWDAIACGNLYDSWGKEAIVVARPVDGGTVDIYEYADAGGALRWYDRLDIPFSSYDGLVIADMDPNNPDDEIVVGSDSAQRIYVYDQRGNLVMEIPCEPYTAYDSLVGGDFDGDGFDELAVLIDDVVSGCKRRLHIFNNACVSYDPAAGWQLVSRRNYLIYSRFLHFDGVRNTAGSGFDWVTCDDINGDGRQEICVARQGDDRLYVLDGYYSQGWMDRYLPVLQEDQDLIDLFVLIGHGNPGFCSPFSETDIGTLNLTAGPLVFALSCLTGNYEGEWWWYDHGVVDAHSDGDDGFAETFFAHGAAAYIGSTEVSGPANAVAGPAFLSQWDPDETAGKAFRDYRRGRAGSDDDDWRYWAMEYNYYGDPKFGALDGGLAAASVNKPDLSIAAADPLPADPEIEVPDYQIATVDGKDHVTIPGGDVLIEPNVPRVPIYRVEWEVPPGVVVQNVEIRQRGDLRTDIGLILPVTAMRTYFLDDANDLNVEPEPGWCPDRQLDWRIIPGADGAATLAVTLYPFEYNAQTTECRFYRQYTLDVETLDSRVRITALLTDSRTYAPGDPVTVQLGLSAEGQAQDAYVETAIRQYGSDELVAGLLLDDLGGLAGTASYAATWDSAAATPGFYYVETKIVDATGQILARETALFRLKPQE